MSDDLRARIAHLEAWHARQDCVERGHTLPDGWTRPDPADLDGVREEIDITAWGAPGQTITALVGLPDHVAQVPCAHCGDAVLGVDLAERERVRPGTDSGARYPTQPTRATPKGRERFRE